MLKNRVNQFKFGQFRKKCGANRYLLIMKWTAKQENNRALERTVFSTVYVQVLVQGSTTTARKSVAKFVTAAWMETMCVDL